MRIRLLKICLTLGGFIAAVIGLGGTPDNLAAWRDWFELFWNLLFPDAARTFLILGGIAIIIAVNVPGGRWVKVGGGFRQRLDRKYRLRRLVGRVGELRASGVALRNELERPGWEDDVRSWEQECVTAIRGLSISDAWYVKTLDVFQPRVGGSIVRQSLDGKLQRLLEIMRRHDPDFNAGRNPSGDLSSTIASFAALMREAEGIKIVWASDTTSDLEEIYREAIAWTKQAISVISDRLGSIADLQVRVMAELPLDQPIIDSDFDKQLAHEQNPEKLSLVRRRYYKVYYWVRDYIESTANQ